jgi:YD repeat-containing protein
VDQISFKQGANSRMTTTKTYDDVNRLTSIVSKTNSVAVSSFGYAYNSANQRTVVTNTDTSLWRYGYDSLGQVTSGKKYWSDNMLAAGQQFGYQFDDIGNRTTTTTGGNEFGANPRWASYTANNLNQYTNRTVPGFLDIIGTASTSATVTVNDTPTHRHSSYYRAELAADNGSSSLWQSISTLGVVPNGASPDIVSNITGNIFLPKTPESFSYDADGNLTQDGRWSYTWDAENRLIKMTSLSTAPTASKFNLDFSYDYLNRRIQKLVSTNSGSAYVAQYTNRFVYDAWNLQAILDPQSSVLQSFIWGLDLSGSLKGAGGVAGLLAVAGSNSSQFACFDHYCPGIDRVAWGMGQCFSAFGAGSGV